jgi:hypothetical protein
MIDPATALNLAVLYYRAADVVTLAERARLLAAAGTAYLEAEAAGKVPAREKRRYTSQLAHAAVATGRQATRPHERDAAIGPLDEIAGLAAQEQQTERDALKKRTEPVEAGPLDPNRYDVREGLVG